MSRQSQNWQYKKCEKNILEENYAQVRNYFSKMSELDQISLQERLFASVKGHIRLTKGHLDNPEGQVEVESPRIGNYF